MPTSTNERVDPPRPRPGQTSSPVDPSTTDHVPLPHQLATVREEQLRGIRLLYPGLHDIRDQDLREAVYAHRRQLARQVPQAHYDRLPTHRRRRPPDQSEILRYRAAHPETRWMSGGGVAAAMLFEQERGRWLREGFLAERSEETETHDVGGAADGLGIQVASERSAAHASVQHTTKSQSLEPTDAEVEELQAQCAATAALSPNHIRSIVIYLRQRRRRRRAKHDSTYDFKSDGGTALSVPESSIRRRINELQQTASRPSVIQRANVHRVQELQRLVADERDRRLRRGERVAGYVVDRAVQTIESSRVQDLVPAQGDLGPGVEVQVEDADIEDGESDEETAVEEDGEGVDDDDDDGGGGDDGDEDEEYHDLFEELHGELL